MTQQSLITRLKAVEEALEYCDGIFTESGDIIDVSEPLSDLRDLIREAEGQEGYFDMVVLESGAFAKRTLYTALGEKP